MKRERPRAKGEGGAAEGTISPLKLQGDERIDPDGSRI